MEQKKIDLEKQIADLAKSISGEHDNLMGEFFINFAGYLLCSPKTQEEKDKEWPNTIKEPATNPGSSDDERTFGRDIENFNGKWHLEFKIRRNCQLEKK